MLRDLVTLRADAREIFAAALKAADPAEAIRRHVRPAGGELIAGDTGYDLRDIDHIYVIGAGKAAATMALAVEELIGERIAGGLVNTKYGHTAPLSRVRINECGHPVPDAAGVEGARRIADIARSAGERDLLLCVISGGGSALLPYPADDITLEDKQQTTRLLLECGADIHEINAVRKHISAIKGGRLAALAYPARVLSVILSDVIGNDLDVIASGATAPDSSTFADALRIVDRYHLRERVPFAVRRHLEEGREETPKPDHPAFARVQNLVVGSNDLALNAAANTARGLGYNTLVLSSFVEGETREVARMHTAVAREVRHSGQPVPAPACVISGGETTVTIRGSGKGGRNQEFALSAALDLERVANTVVLSGGTDGTDGPTDAAGALADSTTVARARAAGLSAARHLDDNNAYPFFDTLGDLLRTGPTGTNVMDVRLVLAG